MREYRSTIVIIGLIFLSGCFSQSSPERSRENERPNVIIILTDDQGSIDMNCYGSKDLYTPNMDALAGTGIMFTQFYAGSPVCSPSRASLLTGRTSKGAGLTRNSGSGVKNSTGMPENQITIAEVMKKAGYTTGHIGKWHLGYTPETLPNAQGFDYSFGHMGGCIDNYSHYYFWAGPNRHDLWKNGTEVWHDGEYFPDLMAKEVKLFIERNRDNPFLLYYAINMPHYPLQATAKWRDYYKDLPSPRNKYAAFVSTIDERIGWLLEDLDELSLRENTIIIYQSDHGHSCEERNFGGGGNAGPYRGAKFSLFEGGIRIPAIISWRGSIPEGEVRDQVCTSMDWYATICDLCDIGFSHQIFGRSLKEVIYEDKPGPHQFIVWQYASPDVWAVRKGKWKLLNNPWDPARKAPLDPEKDKCFLVDLDKDISELNNLAGQYPGKVKELHEIYLEWMEQFE